MNGFHDNRRHLRFERLESRLALAYGDLDASFGDAGRVVLPFPSPSSVNLSSIALQADNKVVVIRTQDLGDRNAIEVSRLNENGATDLTFGQSGTLLIDSGASLYTEASSMMIQVDGKILVAGSLRNGDDRDIFLARILSNGTLDTAFGSGGMVHLPFAANEGVNAVAVQPDGRILLVASQVESAFSALFARLLTNGEVDTTFGTDGFVKISIPQGSISLLGLAVQPDGKILAAGNSFLDGPEPQLPATLVRLTPAGTLDVAFGEAGIVQTRYPSTSLNVSFANDLAILPDGKILVGGANVVVGDSVGIIAAARFDPDGQLDQTFGAAGIVTTSIDAGDDRAFSLAVRGDGRFTLAGQASDGVATRFAAVYCNADGSLDTTVQGDGKIMIDWVGSNAIARNIVLTKGGDLIIGGSVTTGAERSLGIVKLQGDDVIETPWRNRSHPLNASNDPAHNISPLDALVIINELNSRGTNAVPSPQSKMFPEHYLDTSGDNFVSPLDALLVINELNSPTPGGAEGEPTRDARETVIDFTIRMNKPVPLGLSETTSDSELIWEAFLSHLSVQLSQQRRVLVDNAFAGNDG